WIAWSSQFHSYKKWTISHIRQLTCIWESTHDNSPSTNCIAVTILQNTLTSNIEAPNLLQ
ncbi:hypothetical protein HN873_056619, partial [Arachis hypogaea]